MSTQTHPAPAPQKLSGGFVGAVVLHVVFAAAILLFGLLPGFHKPNWGEHASSVGSIQASIVSAIPLPPRAQPMEHSVLTSENVSPAAEEKPKEATAPPPKPTDVLIKKPETKPPPVKPAPREAEAVKHPQPAQPTPKATSGDNATQLPQATAQATNGTATITVQNRTFGDRYAYYLRGVSNTCARNYNQNQFSVDPRASEGKSVSITFDIQRDGSVANLRVARSSGSPTLDNAAKRAVLEVDSFGQLPEGDRLPIEFKFDYSTHR